MSEVIDNATRRKELLKHMIRQLHDGTAPQAVRAQLARLLGEVPYGDVVEVEQELMAEGLPEKEVLELCDVHAEALSGLVQIRKPKKPLPTGHPVHTFAAENQALRLEVKQVAKLSADLTVADPQQDVSSVWSALRLRFNALMDVEKHYLRKEHLLFPFLEKHGITGPPKIMWGKHDETRALLKSAAEALASTRTVTAGEAKGVIDLVLAPACKAITDMTDKEEQILFPMCLDTLSSQEWFEIARQSSEIGFCLYDPPSEWRPDDLPESLAQESQSGRIQLKSGSFDLAELEAMLNTIPFDITFVDAKDTVRYFTQGAERIFARTRAILGRKVQYCHPPSSVHTVEQILEQFRNGNKDRAAFWIEMKGRFISIEYFAMRDADGQYLGCIEVSQDLTDKRALQGEQRLLTWEREVEHGE
ncbi:MAG TPA: DUF438 domain-containing protein [Polyangiaceae bacterium]|jgi:hypothetical protein|nr:MAG: PAS fold protein [Deltaproteobacteria bacterium ADurb.Bin207]HNS96233.1 DUF438 domain-containing protein [Polyangiaceae bacterium]HNZ20823.1 DUF438 domain-containing protein [Polyangiaceae bacterium]HOD22645.1 DUF438 domain-containing protein [Polyangiaceae bacterium]HOE48253.1 DUF438 domain-containing protein [Polyangiaceae bacterium]